MFRGIIDRAARAEYRRCGGERGDGVFPGKLILVLWVIWLWVCDWCGEAFNRLARLWCKFGVVYY